MKFWYLAVAEKLAHDAPVPDALSGQQHEVFLFMIAKLFASAAVAALMAVAPVAAQAQEKQPLSSEQTEAVRKVVRDYIMEHPEIIGDAIEALREKQRLAAEAEAKKTLTERKADLYNDPDSPSVGNQKGDVTIVEFMDYRCGYCKSVHDGLLEAVKADGKVRLVYKDFPILGPDSVLAARAALAAREQNKYEELHNALIKFRGPLNEQAILKLATDTGLNAEQLKKDMADPKVENTLRKNFELARALDLSGTPAFIIGDRLIPGAADQATIKQLIDQARKPKDKG